MQKIDSEKETYNTTKTEINKESWGDISNFIKGPGKEARAPYGSKKEFQFKILADNWMLDNTRLGVLLGVCAGRVSHLRKSMRERPAMLEIAFNDFMRLKNSPNVPDSTKYQSTVRLLCSLLNEQPNTIDRNDEVKNKREEVLRNVVLKDYSLVFAGVVPISSSSVSVSEAKNERVVKSEAVS